MKFNDDKCAYCGHKRNDHADHRQEGTKECYKRIKLSKAIYKCTCENFKEEYEDG